MGTMLKTADVLQEIEQTLGQVPHWVTPMPEPVLTSFWTTMRDLELADTLIPRKYKELIGLAVSGATRCRYCALFHTEGARLNGATDQEISEASAMAGFTMFASTYLNAQQTDYERFKKETGEIVAYVKKQMLSKGTEKKEAPRAHA